jgi:lysophospholipase L1-like esterase
MRRFREFALNLLLLGSSLLVFFAFCEFLLFRTLLPGSDVPRHDYVEEVIRYAPNQSGVWRIRNEIAANYRINKQGWNSGLTEYTRERRAGVARIAVVGDSYVEALQVPHTQSFAEVLEQTLGGRERTEVYRFGISGAPLSQYVHMVEREVALYRPDWIVVTIVHNDFDESYRFVQGRYTSSFMKFRIESGAVAGETPPTPWRPRWVDAIRQTATARFLYYRWHVRPQVVLDLVFPRAAADNRWAANVDIDAVLAGQREVIAVANHAAGRLAAAARAMGASLLLVMDGDRFSLYQGNSTSRAIALNKVMTDAAAHHGVPLLDLQPVFAAHWAVHRRRFDFASDGHWNELGHSVVGVAVAERIRKAL